MKKYLLILLLSYSLSYAQIYTQTDVDICENKFELALSNKLADLPINEIIIALGKSFLGTGYEAFTLEKGEVEELVVSLGGVDCYTFLESCLVLARNIAENKMSFEDFLRELKNVRYRKGEIEDYTSRLHYFSDWIYEMDKRGIVKDVTKDIGGIKYQNDTYFMSTHPEYYGRLKNHPDFVIKMQEIEKKISKRSYYYIPESDIEKIEKNIMSGDILGITTDIEGLDIVHTGIAIRLDDDRIHLLHAPNIGKKVQISESTLSAYVKRNRKQTGIIVVRPLQP